MLIKKLNKLLDDWFKTHPTLFLIDLKTDMDNKFRISVDDDKGITLKQCAELSRYLHRELEEEEEVFSIEVGSAGADAPLKLWRQFPKHLGRTLHLKTLDNQSYKGTLKEADEKQIKIGWKSKAPKTIGKGKTIVANEKEIALAQIEEARVILKF